jgi:hypothetical protein
MANAMACRSPRANYAKRFFKSLFSIKDDRHADTRRCIDAIYRNTKVKMVDISMNGPNGISVSPVDVGDIMAINTIKPPGF